MICIILDVGFTVRSVLNSVVLPVADASVAVARRGLLRLHTVVMVGGVD